MVGRELIFDPSLSLIERIYVRVFGAPISGLRIRYRRLMPVIKNVVREHRMHCNGQVSIIDVGCGTGLFTMELAKQFPGSDVLGVDNWTELVEKDRKIVASAGIENCRFDVEDILNLKRTETYDIALCVDNLEHIDDDNKAIRVIHQCLKPGGVAVFHVPGLYRRWLFFGKQKNFDVKGHVRPGYTLEDISAKIKKEGFTIQEAHYTYGWLETVANNISYLITGADRRNKYFYALVFPFLNALAVLGQWSQPAWGAGVAITARRLTDHAE